MDFAKTNPPIFLDNFMSNLPTTTLPLPALIMNDSLLENGQVRKEEDICHGDEREDTWFERKFGRLTNLQILIIISVLFTLFVVAEIVGALVSELDVSQLVSHSLTHSGFFFH